MVKFVNVDYRIVHGQVILGWGRVLCIRHLVIIDDKSAADSFASSMLKLGIPADMSHVIIPESKTIEALNAESVKKKETMVVLPGVPEALRFVQRVPTELINFGNVKETPNAERFTGWCFLTESELNDVRQMMELGVKIDAFPTAKEKKGIHLSQVLAKRWKMN